MIDVVNEYECCGCSACVQRCPQNCIQMIENSEGFLYPKIDYDKCTGCGLCEKVCPMLFEQKGKNSDVEAYGGWNRDEEVRSHSSSGGGFSLLADCLLEKGGVIYGAAMCSDMVVRHRRIESKDDLACLRGSKYVQSDVNKTYVAAKEDLERGCYVLFTGTPCQIAGLKTFLGKEYDRLYTCDFICHGVPSPLVFRKYIEWLNSYCNDRVVAFLFRNKIAPWRQTGQQMGTVATYASGKERRFIPAYKDAFMNGFLSDLYLRKSCYACHFKHPVPEEIVADITLADFWKVNRVDQSINSEKGTTLLLINTRHGNELFEQVKKGFAGKKVDALKAVAGNASYFYSAREPMAAERQAFFNDLCNKPFIYVKRRYLTGVYWMSHKVISIGRKILTKGKI